MRSPWRVRLVHVQVYVAALPCAGLYVGQYAHASLPLSTHALYTRLMLTGRRDGVRWWLVQLQGRHCCSQGAQLMVVCACCVGPATLHDCECRPESDRECTNITMIVFTCLPSQHTLPNNIILLHAGKRRLVTVGSLLLCTLLRELMKHVVHGETFHAGPARGTTAWQHMYYCAA